MNVQRINRDLGIVLGLCGHWWQARTVPEVMAMDCPTCQRPPGVFIGCWDETWPEPEPQCEGSCDCSVGICNEPSDAWCDHCPVHCDCPIHGPVSK